MKPLVKITWHDARDSDGTWVDEEDIDSFSKTDVAIISIGFLLRETPKYVTIAGDYNESDGDYGRVCKIPVGMVIAKALLESP